MSNGVREIPESVFNAWPEAQQRFFLDQIKQGRAKIIPNSSPATSRKDDSKSADKSSRPDPLTPMIGHQVKLQLVNGDILTGRLKDLYLYEVSLETCATEIVVLKHCVMTVEVIS